MAVDVNSAEALRVKEALGSVGLDGSGDAATLRRSTLDMLNRLGKLLIGPDAPKLTTYDPEAIAKLKEAIRAEFMAPNEKGVTGLQNFQAIVDGNVGFLTKDLSAIESGIATLGLNRIYSAHKNDPGKAAAEALKFASQANDFAKKMLPRLQSQRLAGHIPAALALINNREQFFNDLDALKNAGLFDAAPASQPAVAAEVKPEGGASAPVSAPAAAAPVAAANAPAAETAVAETAPPPQEEAPLDPEQILAQAVVTIKANIGAQPGVEIGRADQDLLKQKILAFQNDAFFGEGWTGPKNGLYSPEFAEHLSARAGAMPEATELEKEAKGNMRKFAEALKTVAGDYGVDLISAKDKLSVAEASHVAETALGLMSRPINEFLAGKQSETQENIEKQPEFLRGLFTMLAQGKAGNLLGTRIPEPGKPDEIFDMRSQGSLQALLIVLGDPNVMNIPELANGLYEPATGQKMLASVGPLKEKLKKEAPEKFVEIEPLLTQDNLQKVVDALDVLHENGKIAREPLFARNKAAELPALHNAILTEEVSRLGEENPDALKLMDGLIRQFTGVYGIPSLLPGNEGLEGEIDASKTPEKRLSEFYKGAKARHIADGGTHESFKSEMLLVLNTVLAMPFGSGAQRSFFNAGVREVLNNAEAESDPARAAEIFGNGVAALSTEIPGGAGGFKYANDPARGISWHPRLEGATFTSGGVAYTSAQIAALYDAKVQDDSLSGRDTALFFRDDNGDLFVAAIQQESRMFLVEKVNMDNMRKVLDAGGGDAALIAQMKESDRAFELVFSKDGSRNLGGDYASFADRALMPDGFITLSQSMSAGYGEKAKQMQAVKAEAAVKKASFIPVSSDLPPSLTRVDPVSSGGARRMRPYEGHDGNAGGLMNASHQITEDRQANGKLRQELTNIGSRLSRAPMTFEQGDKRLDALMAGAGQAWRIGESYKSSFQLKGVDASRSGGTGPQAAWYDAKEKTIKVITAPDYMTHPGLRLMARMKDGESPRDYYDRIKEKYPELFEIAQAYHDGPQRLKGEPLSTEHYWNFHVTVDRVAGGLANRDMQMRVPEHGRQTFLASLFSKGSGERRAPVEDRSIPAEVSVPASGPSGAVYASNPEKDGGFLSGLRDKFGQMVHGKPSEDKAAVFREEGQAITGPSIPDYTNYPFPGGGQIKPGGKAMS